MSMTADVRLHSAIERAISQTPRRDRYGRFAKKPKPRDIITHALLAEYGGKSVAASLDAIPLPVQHLEQPIEAAADSFFTPMMVLHLVLGTACMAMAFLHPVLIPLARIVLVCLGALCWWLSYRCEP